MEYRKNHEVNSKIMDLYKSGSFTLRQIAEQLGTTKKAVERRLDRMKSKMSRSEKEAIKSIKSSRSNQEQTDELINFIEENNQATVTKTCKKPVKTIEDAIRECEIDTSVWFVKSWRANAWTTTMKLKKQMRCEGCDSLICEHSKTVESPTQIQNYGVELKLERIIPKHKEEALKIIYDKMAKHSPNYKPTIKLHKNGERYLTVMGLFDAHFGKLAWEAEVGNNYDLKIADTVYRNAVNDALDDVKGKNIDSFVLPIGNDFYHVDNTKGTTTSGTQLDQDSRFAKIIATGELAVIWAIEELLKVAPVKVIWIPGNHDFQCSYHLTRTVAAWFRNCGQVTVDCSPQTRKYVRFGTNLLGFTHGDSEKKINLVNLMPNERPNDFAETTCREWLTGHLHQSSHYMTQPTRTQDAMVIRVLPSIAGTDFWHYRNSFINLNRSAEIYLYGENRGYAGHFRIEARE